MKHRKELWVCYNEKCPLAFLTFFSQKYGHDTSKRLISNFKFAWLAEFGLHMRDNYWCLTSISRETQLQYL
jgi:hypothetical protein